MLCFSHFTAAFTDSGYRAEKNGRSHVPRERGGSLRASLLFLFRHLYFGRCRQIIDWLEQCGHTGSRSLLPLREMCVRMGLRLIDEFLLSRNEVLRNTAKATRPAGGHSALSLYEALYPWPDARWRRRLPYNGNIWMARINCYLG